MAFTISYGPSAASVGSLGALIGSGQARRENAQMQNDFARQGLGVLLQDRNAQNQFNLQVDSMRNNEAARANQQRLQWQRFQAENQLQQTTLMLDQFQIGTINKLAFADEAMTTLRAASYCAMVHHQ